jgi:ABC-type multidrug transport system ATPase subunit
MFYVPDGIAPWRDQPLDRVIRFFRDLWEVPAERVGSVVEMLKLRPLLGTRVGSLSKGERKRSLIAFGLLSPQSLLMLDEPFDGLDLRQTREAISILRAEAECGRTLFLSIHQLADAGRACDRLVLLADGRVVGEGTLAEVRERAGLAEGGVEEVFLALT